MPKRVFDRSTSYESCVIDMHTGKPVPAETKPIDVYKRQQLYLGSLPLMLWGSKT